MRRAIAAVLPLLRPFRKLLPRYKQAYLRALEDACAAPSLLQASDLLMLFDETNFLLHIRISPRERGQAPAPGALGRGLLALLEERRTYAGPLRTGAPLATLYTRHMSKWVHLATAPDQITAEIWLDILRQEGITAMIRPSDAVSFMGVSAVGCRLQIAEEDLHRARALLGDEVT